MKFTPIACTLKNKITVLIRMAKKTDANGLVAASMDYLAESPFFITSINEFNVTKQQEAAWIQDLNDQKNSLLLVAEYNGKIIGKAHLRGEPRKKIFHNAVLSIALIKKWQGLGLGTILMQQLILWATQNPYLQMIWLNVHGTNARAIQLYQNLGFTQVGIQKNYIQQKDQEYTDNLLMLLTLPFLEEPPTLK